MVDACGDPLLGHVNSSTHIKGLRAIVKIALTDYTV